MRRMLENINWERELRGRHMEEKWEGLKRIINEAVTRYIPLRKNVGTLSSLDNKQNKTAGKKEKETSSYILVAIYSYGMVLLWET